MAITVGTQYGVINVATATTHTIVAAVTGKRIYVTSFLLMCTGANTLTWRRGTTPISGAMGFAANTGYAMGDGKTPVLMTGIGEALVLLLGAAQQVSGHLTYELV